MSRHLSVAELSEFITGQAAENQQLRIIRHLETCETCLGVIDSLWSETMSALQKNAIPEIKSGRTIWLRRRILRRIHSFETNRSILQLALFGPVIFLKGLLEPWQSRDSKPKNNGGPQ